MKLSELNEIHASPSSWKVGFIYFAPRDPRLLVRKRIGTLGWTLNFARPLALPFLIATVLGFWIGMSGLASSNLPEDLKWAGLLGMITALILIWAWVANPRRYQH